MLGPAVLIFVYIAVLGLIVVGACFMFAKAGEAGWKALIPIWNSVVLLRIIGRPVWWIILLIIPLVGIVFSALIAHDLAKSFGKGVLFAAGLWLLSPVFIPILGFGGSRYHGPAAAETWGEGSLF